MSLKLKGNSSPTHIAFNFPPVHIIELPIRFTCVLCGDVIDFASVSNPTPEGAYSVELHPHQCRES